MIKNGDRQIIFKTDKEGGGITDILPSCMKVSGGLMKQKETCVYLLWANRRRRCFSFFGSCDPFIT